MLRLRHFLILVISFSTILGSTSFVLGQDEEQSQTCPIFVNQALSSLGNSCSNLDPESICYGFSNMLIELLDGVQLENPADRAALLNLKSLTGEPFQAVQEIWGISVLNIQANLHIDNQRTPVRILTLGDIRVENGVFPNEALILEESIQVNVATNPANVFDYPPGFGTPSNVVGEVGSGNTQRLQADAMSTDGLWIRVAFDYETEYAEVDSAWISISDLEETPELADLPVIGPETYTPMQKFYFETQSITSLECEEVPPPLVMLQAPRNLETRIVADDAEISFNGTTLIWAFPNQEFMRVTTLEGITRLNPDSPQQVVLPAGYTTTICLEGPFDLGVDLEENDYRVGNTCSWSGASAIEQSDIDSLASLQRIPGNIINKPVVVPRLVCGSGIGGVVCVFRYGDGNYTDRLRALCDAGILPDQICDTLP